MTAGNLIKQSVKLSVTAVALYDMTRLEVLHRECEDHARYLDDEDGDTWEFWGTDDDGEPWRVQLALVPREATVRP
jgi:hypothetical protein